MSESIKPIQKILFGSPGTGKSYQIQQIAKEYLSIPWDEQGKPPENVIRTIFHPEYSYSDFMGKLLPTTEGRDVTYKYYEGHFLAALGLAYKYHINKENKHVILVIDELNRGNAAAIFGSIFQLLDRELDGWSTYPIRLSELETTKILNVMGYANEEIKITDGKISIPIEEEDMQAFVTLEKTADRRIERGISSINDPDMKIFKYLDKYTVAIPDNLSIISTINTSDESIYYLDSAFKRRWDWEYIETPEATSSKNIELLEIPEEIRDVFVDLPIDRNSSGYYSWGKLVLSFNQFIKSKHNLIRHIEDKQIGYWFIKPNENKIISWYKIKNKLMFYTWDTVFPRNKDILSDFFAGGEKLVTYSDFTKYTKQFIETLVGEPEDCFDNDNSDIFPTEDSPFDEF